MSTDIYAPHEIGRVEVDAPDAMVAGSMATIRVIYTAGKFGLDDQGGIRLLLRFASDFGRPQLERPNAPNYVSAVASNGATLVTTYDSIAGVRPWFKVLSVRIMKQFLREGDTITVTLGERSEGSAGMRIQTSAEPTFEVRVQANPFGTNVYADVPGGKTISVVAGEPVLWKGIWPTMIRVREPFWLAIKAEDACGNPTTATATAAARILRLRPSRPVHGLPATVHIGVGDHPFVIEALSVVEPGDIELDLFDESGACVGSANLMRVVEGVAHRHFWGDFHAQSEETIGTNSARDYFLFARDQAFVDFVGHQGNDFQISNAFWEELNRLTREFNNEGRFVTIPGYEWSGVTGLGGDRNINFKREGVQIRRSSHALVEDVSDIETDCNHASDLFRALRASGEECFAFAHIGGRYADLSVAHDGVIEKSVEIHSAWGTFEWLLYDAFDLNYRVGVVCNSDDHKGRPGASHPGASIFGAYGGLTCLLTSTLTRDTIFDVVRKRHHYGTTGARIFLAVNAAFDGPAARFDDDPALGPTQSSPVSVAAMGDIVQLGPRTGASVSVSVAAATPILKVELRIGKEVVETIRPFGKQDLGRRYRVMWEGAEVRGRGRMTEWDGSLQLKGNAIHSIEPFNFWHLEKAARLESPECVSWESVTTGNFAGFDLMLGEADAGELRITTAQAQLSTAISAIDQDGVHVDAGGIRKRLSVFRLPDANPAKTLDFDRRIALHEVGDTPVYVCVTLENGHQAWSSPIYLFK
jgi:hypothetical protein